jgi:hypothetical protein
MLVSYEGRMGQGKTLAVTAMAVMEQERTGKRIFSTYHLSDVITCPMCRLPHPIRVGEDSEGKYEAYECKGSFYAVREEDEEKIHRIHYTYISFEDFYRIFKEADQGLRTLSNCLFLIDEAYLFMDSRTSGSKMNRIFNSFIFQTRKRGVDVYIATHSLARIDKRVRAAIDVAISCRFNLATSIATLKIRDMHTASRRTMRLFGPLYWHFYDTRELVLPEGKLYRLKAEDLAS